MMKNPLDQAVTLFDAEGTHQVNVVTYVEFRGATMPAVLRLVAEWVERNTWVQPLLKDVWVAIRSLHSDKTSDTEEGATIWESSLRIERPEPQS